MREVVAGLAKRDDLAMTVLASPSAPLPAGVARTRTLRVAPGRWQAREHELLLPFDLRRVESDVVFSPAMDPPSRCRPPWVQTVHDLIPLQGADPGLEQRFRRAASRFRDAAAIITVSQWTADEVLRTLDVDAARVHVIPHGVSERYQPGSGPRDEDPYVLFVGEYDPRKRHDVAFAAISALADRGMPHVLKVTGRIAPWFVETMDRLRAAAPRPERVRLLGHVPQDELVELYQRASVLVVTSEAEGFGLPAAEAMACGTPVVAFANSATTEIVGEGGVLVPDGNLTRLVEELAAVLGDASCRAQLSEAALRRAALYRWDHSVARHAEVLKMVAC